MASPERAEPEPAEQDVPRCSCGQPWVDLEEYFAYCPHCDRPGPGPCRPGCMYCRQYVEARKGGDLHG